MDINEQHCPNCAGQLNTDLQLMKKECPFCGATFFIDTQNSSPAPDEIATTPTPTIIEKTSFNIKLNSSGKDKVKTIMVIREFTGLGLKESKDMVDNTPVIVMENIDKELANRFVNQMHQKSPDASVEVV